jgi:hypothetical protein
LNFETHGFVKDKVVGLYDKNAQLWPAKMLDIIDGNILFRYVGWDSTFDEWLESSSKRIERNPDESVFPPEITQENTEVLDKRKSALTMAPKKMKTDQPKLALNNQTAKFRCLNCNRGIYDFRIFCIYCEVDAETDTGKSFHICATCFEYSFPAHQHPRSSFAKDLIEKEDLKSTAFERDIIESHVHSYSEIFCEFCDECDGDFIGPFKTPKYLKLDQEHFWAHDLCARYSPETRISSEGDWYNVGKSLKRGMGLSCFACKEKGATVGCFKTSCDKSFHVRCTGMLEAEFERGMIFFCTKHENLFKSIDQYEDNYSCDNCSKFLNNETWFTCQECNKDYFTTFDLCKSCLDNAFPASHPHSIETFSETSKRFLTRYEGTRSK